MFDTKRVFLLITLIIATGCSGNNWTAHSLAPRETKHISTDQTTTRKLSSAAEPLDKENLQKAIALIMVRKYVKAEDILLGLVEKFRLTKSEHQAATTLFWLGYCAEKQHNAMNAIYYYDQVIMKYPDTVVSQQAKMRKKSIEDSIRK